MTTVRAYTAGDIIAALLSGDQTYRLSHMYVVFENTAGAGTPLVPARADVAGTGGTFLSLAGNYDFIRIPVLPTAVISAVDGNHNGNRATFTGVGTAAVGEAQGLTFSAAANSKVVNIAIVAAPTGAVAGDVLYSHSDLATPLPVAGSGQAGATYAVEID